MLRVTVIVCLLTYDIYAQPTNISLHELYKQTFGEINPSKIHEGCGYRNEERIDSRITRDENNEAQFAEFPWTVAISAAETVLGTQVNTYQCGGSLINPSVVLTVAHCVSGKEPTTLKIRAGEWDTQTNDEIYPHQDINVNDFIIHEQYHKRRLYNDVALLFLAEPAKIAYNVNTICLAPPNHNFDLQRCFVSGWGKDSFGEKGKYQAILKRVELQIVPRDQCLAKMRKTRLGPFFNLHSSFICAGGETGKDACQGDGGSPLVCPVPNTLDRFYQVGMVAWGIGCGDSIPGIYVNISMFRSWIEEKLQLKGIINNSYTLK